MGSVVHEPAHGIPGLKARAAKNPPRDLSQLVNPCLSLMPRESSRPLDPCLSRLEPPRDSSPLVDHCPSLMPRESSPLEPAQHVAPLGSKDLSPLGLCTTLLFGLIFLV